MQTSLSSTTGLVRVQDNTHIRAHELTQTVKLVGFDTVDGGVMVDSAQEKTHSTERLSCRADVSCWGTC